MAQNFKAQQLKFERVKQAYDQKWPALHAALEKGEYGKSFQLYLRAYKAEGKLEIWLKPNGQATYRLFKIYDFCARSGTLGPKLVEGDGQTPEGFYHINVFNPLSNFHLSLGINYPNKVDMAQTTDVNNPGSDIYIHGNCVTVGCIPLTDDKIKEVYVLAVEAKNGGQTQIPVAIFPFKMSASNMKKYTGQFPGQGKFWQTLQTGYQLFEQNKTLPNVKQTKNSYLVK